jgi:hypothetical protein
MKFNIATLLKTAAVVGAVGAIGSAAYATMDYTGVRPVMIREFLQLAQTQADVIQQLQSTQQQSVESIDWLKFNMLLERSKISPLSVDDRRQLCALAGQFSMNAEAGC